METPLKLYHYTSLNTLALILNSKKMLFNRADMVNDKKECLTSDYGSFAQYVFLSCWTATEEEAINLWNTYTKNMDGVRIELPFPVFEIHKIDDVYQGIVKYEEIENIDKKIFIVPPKEIISKVTYTDDDRVLRPNIIKSIGQYEGFQLDCIGTRKKTLWKYENEWRFRLIILPIDSSLNSVFFPDKYSSLVNNRTPPPIDKYFIPIDERIFEKMKIRLGPRMRPGALEIINALVEKYNPTASVEQSSLSEDIR